MFARRKLNEMAGEGLAVAAIPTGTALHGAPSPVASGIAARSQGRRSLASTRAIGGLSALALLGFLAAWTPTDPVYSTNVGLAGFVSVNADVALRCIAVALFMTAGASALSTCGRGPETEWPPVASNEERSNASHSLAHIARTQAVLRSLADATEAPTIDALKTSPSENSEGTDDEPLPGWLRAASPGPRN